MADLRELDRKIAESGYKKTFIAEQLHLTYNGLYRKLSGEREFKASEIEKLKRLLKLTWEQTCDIFL